MAPLPITVLTSIDPLLRDAAAAGVLCDLAGTVVVGHDLSAAGEGTMRRTVADMHGLLEDETLRLGHGCLSCALREDILPTLARVSATGRWRHLVLALPVSAEPALVVQPVAQAEELAGAVTVGSVVAVADGRTFEHDLLGDDLLAERGLQLSDDDRRAVGEALAHQIDYADLVVVTGRRRIGTRELLSHLIGDRTLLLNGIESLDSSRLTAERHDAAAARRRVDPRAVAPIRTGVDELAWTVDLSSWRPFHPERLHSHIHRLGAGRIRGRGRFWLPTRPASLCAWDGAGGQLSIGDVGGWEGASPHTRLIVTGLDDDLDRIAGAFDDVLMTDAELARGLDRWANVDDGFAPWLGHGRTAA